MTDTITALSSLLRKAFELALRAPEAPAPEYLPIPVRVRDPRRGAKPRNGF